VAELGSGSEADETVIFYDDFTGTLTWDTSDHSTVFIKDDRFLYIGTGGHYPPSCLWAPYDDWAEKVIHLELSEQQAIVIEQRMKLQSGGQGYFLAGQSLFFEDSSQFISLRAREVGFVDEHGNWK
jgi:hypothetical protein